MRISVILIAFVLAFCALAAILILYYHRHSMRKLYNELLQNLDKAISGQKLSLSYDESMDSAIKERLNRIVEISSAQKEKAELERDVIKSLISDISHQIRTPLSNITLYSGLLKEESTSAKALMLSDKIEQNSEKLEFFMKELIKSAYTEQEMIVVHPQPADTDELIKKACQLTELLALKKNIQIIHKDNGYQCFADLKWTEEVLGNIIENAVKYSPAGSEISIFSIPYESFICIHIKDKGAGIPEEEQGKIFQRFYRGTNTHNEQGLGIGLYLAREVLSKQQGYIKVESKLNEGTTVKVFLLRRIP